MYHEFKTGSAFQAKPKKDVQFNFPETTDPLTIFDDVPYHTGASAIDHLRKRMDAICGWSGGTSAEALFFYEVLRSIYQAYSTKPLSTSELIRYVAAILPAILSHHGCPLSDVSLSRELSQWQAEWFVLQ